MPRATNTTKKNTTSTRRGATKKVTPKIPTTGVIAIDNGGHYTKVFNEIMENPLSLSSKKAEGHDNLRIVADYNEGTYKIEYEGTIYFMGDLMEEAEGELTGRTNTKNTDFFIISILQAVALHGFKENYVVTCTPYKQYVKKEIEGITDNLVGNHVITINEEEYEFTIADVLVMSEVTPAFFVDKPMGKIRWLDFGSRTVGYATTNDGRLINKETGTIAKMGLDIRKTKSFRAYISEIANILLRTWDEDDDVRVFGGGVEYYPAIMEELENFFNDVKVVDDEEAKFYQVKGMLEAGKNYFNDGQEEDEENGEEE